jgi:hypothetical protein
MMRHLLFFNSFIVLVPLFVSDCCYLYDSYSTHECGVPMSGYVDDFCLPEPLVRSDDIGESKSDSDGGGSSSFGSPVRSKRKRIICDDEDDGGSGGGGGSGTGSDSDSGSRYPKRSRRRAKPADYDYDKAARLQDDLFGEKKPKKKKAPKIPKPKDMRPKYGKGGVSFASYPDDTTTETSLVAQPLPPPLEHKRVRTEHIARSIGRTDAELVEETAERKAREAATTTSKKKKKRKKKKLDWEDDGEEGRDPEEEEGEEDEAVPAPPPADPDASHNYRGRPLPGYGTPSLVHLTPDELKAENAANNANPRWCFLCLFTPANSDAANELGSPYNYLLEYISRSRHRLLPDTLVRKIRTIYELSLVPLLHQFYPDQEVPVWTLLTIQDHINEHDTDARNVYEVAMRNMTTLEALYMKNNIWAQNILNGKGISNNDSVKALLKVQEAKLKLVSKLEPLRAKSSNALASALHASMSSGR